MSIQQTATFQKVIDVIESLPEHQQESLIDVLQRRLIEHRRELLAKNIREAREEFARGEVKRGTVDDLMRELSEREHLFGVKHLQGLLGELSKNIQKRKMIFSCLKLEHMMKYIEPNQSLQLTASTPQLKLYR
jgi:hypothetical protein